MQRNAHIAAAAATFLAGAAVMVIEVAGAHALAPAFGTGLNAWGAILTVTLGSIACGYALGGVLADRRPDSAGRWLAAALALAAAACLADALLWDTLVLSLVYLGVRLGAVIAAAALFALPLAALGAVYPLAVRLWTHSLQELGRRTGWLSALSALGSLTGAALAGFVLVPTLSLEAVFTGCGATLLLAAISAAVAARHWLAAAAAILLLAACPLLPAKSPPPGLLCRRGSMFGPIEVWQDGPVRYLMVARTCQGVGLGEPPTAFMPHVSVISRMLKDRLTDRQQAARSQPARSQPALPANPRVLLIGLGAGFLPRELRPLRCESVEVDPAVLDVARRYFAFDERQFPVHVQDGRAFLLQRPGRYDAIVIDAFSGMDLPYHLLSRECFRLVRRRLGEGGLLLVNYEGLWRGQGGQVVRAIEATLRAEFQAVELYCQAKGPDRGNVIFAAGAGGEAIAWPAEFGYAPRPTFLHDQAGVVLTDGRNPVSLWCAESESRQRRPG